MTGSQGDSDDAAGPGFALTQRQRLIWAEQTLAPDLPANNMVMCFRIAGAVDPARFENAFRRVVNDSEALRTVLRLVEDSPRRMIEPPIDDDNQPLVERVDLSRAPDPDRAFDLWRDERSVRRFDSGSRLFDCAIVKLAPDLSVWYLCQHHLICDAWSFGLIFDRTARLYQDPTQELERDPAGVSAKQLSSEQAYLESERHVADRAFWQERFREKIDPIEPYGLDPSRKGPAVRYASVDLGPERSTRLRALADQDEMRAATPTLGLSLLFMTTLYAYLYRVTGNETLGIGSPVQNRPSRWSKNAIGRFAETCPMRIRFEEGETFQSLHAKVVEESFEVLAHARCSLANPVHAKRHEAMLNFHNASMRAFAGWTVESDLRTGLGALDTQEGGEPSSHAGAWAASETLTLNVHDFEARGDFHLGFEFNADVFDEALRRRAIEHFMNLLEAMLDDPSQRIDSAPMPTAAEWAAWTEALERPAASAPLPNAVEAPESLLERFRNHVASTPDRIALVAGDETYSYEELDRHVRRLSRVLRDAGIEPGMIVGVLLQRTPRFLLAVLAVHDAGASCLPIDPDQPIPRVRRFLEAMAPSFVVTDAAFGDDLPEEVARQIRIDADCEEREVEPASAPMAPKPDSLAFLLCAVDTNGKPRGVEIEHASLSNLASAIVREPGLSPEDRMLVLAAGSFDRSAIEMLLPLAQGASLEIADAATCADPGRLTGRLEDPAIRLVRASPAIWQELIESGWMGRPDLRLWSDSDDLSGELAAALLSRGKEVWRLHGHPETTLWTAVARIRSEDDGIVIGRPIDGTTLHVLTHGREPVPIGTPGELYVGGRGLARGYRNDSQQTSERFLEAPSPLVGPLFKTGDRARPNSLGEIELLGASADPVMIRGIPIALGEVEATLENAEEINEAVVVAAGKTARDRHLIAHVVLHKETRSEVEALVAGLRRQLPESMLPTQWRVLPKLPRTSSGQIDRRALSCDPDEAANLSGEGEAPRDDVEVQIASLWRELLGVETVGRDDDFFELGGQSLMAVEAVRRLGAMLGRRIELATFFENASVAGLRRALAQAGIEHVRTLAVELRAGTGSRPLFCVGGVHLYQELASAFTTSQPVYGVTVHQELEWIAAVERGERPSVPSTEETARECIASLRQHQPHGPYRLAGLSYGGVLAYEIAQQLRREGEQVEGLVLLDARLRTALAGARGPLGGLRRALRNWIASGGGWRRWGKADREALRDRLFEEAVSRYEKTIQPYAGSALLLRACGHSREEIDFDPSLGWGKVIQGGLELADCPGDHVDMLSEAHAADTAREIERYLGGAT